MTARLEARELSFARATREVLHAVSLAIEPGAAVALIGPNAAGTSTLVRCLAGLLAPAAGEVWLDGRPLSAWSRDALARGLAQEPRVLLLDEPGAHLDVGHQLALFRVLDGVRACGVSVLAVVHDLARAAAWAERMVLLEEGRVSAQGTPTEVLTSAACARAFGVRIAAHNVPGAKLPLWSFEEGP